MSGMADLARARDALQAIPPDLPRDEWVRAGMAAKAAGLSFEDFDSWSAQADSYNAAAARDTWRSFKDGKGIGPGTLFHLASGAGWRPDGARPEAGRKVQQQRQSAPVPTQRSTGAAEVWARCSPATADHPYIVAKDGAPHGLRVVPPGDPLHIKGLSMAGALVVPVLPLDGGQPASLQFIAPPELAAQWKAAGKPGKLNLPRAPMAGVFMVGELAPGGLAYVVEGIGQAWACWKATGAAAVVAFGWGNVKRVAAELRQRDAAARLVLVPDAGKEADAVAVAAELGVEVVTMPAGSPDNFDANDYAKAEGFDALEVLLASTQPEAGPAALPDPWRVVPLDDLDSAELPQQQWAWHGYIPAGEVTMLGAHGGTGKSTIALMLAAAVPRGAPLFGVATTPAPVVFFSAEDGADTVRRRLRHVLRAAGLSAADLAGMVTVLDATHGAPELGSPMTDAAGRQTFGPTPTGERLREFLADKPGALLIVDNASDTMGGNENARPEVRAFVRLLASMVRDTGGAVLLLAHVDKGTSRGERSGSEGYSGSTAWHNSARSRLYLSRDKDGTLLLEHQKNNLGPLRDPLRLIWPPDGLPTLDQPLSGTVQRIASDNDTRALLRLVHEFTGRGEFVTTATTSRTHAGALMRGEASFPRRLNNGQVFDLLRNAERRGWLQKVEYRGSDRKPRERWQVTLAGAQVAEIADFAATAATAATSDDPAATAPGAASPAEPAATAATSPPGGMGGTARTQVAAETTP